MYEYTSTVGPGKSGTFKDGCLGFLNIEAQDGWRFVGVMENGDFLLERELEE